MSLAEFKVFQAREIDLAAEAARQQFVTPGDGMAAVYRQKLLAGRDDGVASSHVATAYVYRACHMRGGGRCACAWSRMICSAGTICRMNLSRR